MRVGDTKIRMNLVKEIGVEEIQFLWCLNLFLLLLLLLLQTMLLVLTKAKHVVIDD